MCLVVVGGVAALAGGCFVEHSSPPPDTVIEFDEITNLGSGCGGPLTTWTVTNRETQTQGTAGCQQPVLFTNLAPGATYTFDIEGFDQSRLCWQGSCAVFANGYTTSIADCFNSVQHLCGF